MARRGCNWLLNSYIKVSDKNGDQHLILQIIATLDIISSSGLIDPVLSKHDTIEVCCSIGSCASIYDTHTAVKAKWAVTRTGF